MEWSSCRQTGRESTDGSSWANSWTASFDMDYEGGSRSRRGSRRSQQFGTKSVTRTVARIRRPVEAISSTFIATAAAGMFMITLGREPAQTPGEHQANAGTRSG